MSDGRFTKEGEYWTIMYQGVVIRVRDAKGMRSLARLLGRPRERIPVAALLAEDVATEAENGWTAEQARLTVTKRIKAAVKKIELHHPALGHHLGSCVHTGRFCCYSPDPSRIIEWQFR